MIVKVTQHHIDTGKAGNCRHCPIALAFFDLGFKSVYVGKSRITLSKILDAPSWECIEYTAPELAIEFIDTFDSNLKVSPIEFELIN